MGSCRQREALTDYDERRKSDSQNDQGFRKSYDQMR